MEKLLTVEDVMAETHSGRAKVFEWIKAGLLDSLKLGKRRLVPSGALEEFVAQQRADQTRERTG